MSANNEIKQIDLDINRKFHFESTIKINFHSSKAALLVKSCLDVDEELQPTKINRSISIDGTFLNM